MTHYLVRQVRPVRQVCQSRSTNALHTKPGNNVTKAVPDPDGFFSAVYNPAYSR